jgi:hypothetical protein
MTLVGVFLLKLLSQRGKPGTGLILANASSSIIRPLRRPHVFAVWQHLHASRTRVPVTSENGHFRWSFSGFLSHGLTGLNLFPWCRASEGLGKPQQDLGTGRPSMSILLKRNRGVGRQTPGRNPSTCRGPTLPTTYQPNRHPPHQSGRVPSSLPTTGPKSQIGREGARLSPCS